VEKNFAWAPAVHFREWVSAELRKNLTLPCLLRDAEDLERLANE
jgi:hypothetical protein